MECSLYVGVEPRDAIGVGLRRKVSPRRDAKGITEIGADKRQRDGSDGKCSS